MLEIIKTIRICDKFNLSLIYLQKARVYEIQYSDDDNILEVDGEYSNKIDGIKAFNQFKNKLIKEKTQEEV